jgi:hypothetical protein
MLLLILTTVAMHGTSRNRSVCDPMVLVANVLDMVASSRMYLVAATIKSGPDNINMIPKVFLLRKGLFHE